METTIKVSDNVKKHLDKMKIYERETYNDLIEVLIEDSIGFTEDTKKEIEKRIKRPEFVSHEEVKKRLDI